jgi:festuclavine dehydrogenase
MNSMLISPLKTAQILTEVIGKRITHVNLTEQEFVDQLTSAGLSEDQAKSLASLEGVIKEGGEERLNDVVLKITGQPPRTFREYAEASKSEWIP